MKEYAIGAELTPEKAKEEMQAGRVLITGDGSERAMLYKNQFVCWNISGNVAHVLMLLDNFEGWYIQEREDFPTREIITVKNTDLPMLNKRFFA